ncbi:MAG: succinylglutamate desuccinylase [Alphaproteobacteria bacterium]|nr:succinylglutamate desuccinylase [Alphaproteobacteria bacterium]
MLEIVTFASKNPGTNLLVLGAVHGNEICGPKAIRHIIGRFNAGELTVAAGSVTFVPVCNPRAYEENKRFIEHNLNRAFKRREQPTLYEHHLMNELAPLLESCDVLLDIHSYTAGGPAFAFRGLDELRDREEPFIAALDVDHVIYGWGEAYAASGVVKDPVESMGTTEYAREHGAIATTVECGQHLDPAGVPVAIRAIEGALAHCGLVPELARVQDNKLRRTRIKKLFYKQRAGSFAKPWKHLDEMKQGEVVATFDDGEAIIAPFTGRIVLPNATCPVGQEWFYLGVDE